jgi:hypothetical protein
MIWVMSQISPQLILRVRADSGLVVLTLKLLLVIDGNDIVTCVDIDTIKNLKRASDCEVRASKHARLAYFAFDTAQVLVFCDTIRHEQVQKQGVFSKMVHSPTQKSSKSSAQVRASALVKSI